MTKKLDTSSISAFAQKIGMMKEGTASSSAASAAADIQNAPKASPHQMSAVRETAAAVQTEGLPDTAQAANPVRSRITHRELRNKRFNLLLPPSLFERLEKLRGITGRSVNDLINLAIDDLLKGEGL